MRTDFILPDIGEGIVECELVEWLVSAGEQIVEDQPVAEVMTDKAVVQIPAMHSGTVEELYYQKGDIAKVHQPLFAMRVEGEKSTENDVKVDNSASAAPAENTQSQQSAPSTASSGIEDFILPDIGEGIVECELVKWHIQEGDMIQEDQPVAEVMTDKAVVEIPAKHTGKVVRLYYQQGEIAKVHTPLFAMEVEGSTSQAAAPASSQTNAQAPAQSTSAQAQTSSNEAPVSARPGKAVASPAVRRRAREMNIDISLVQGSGKKGRVMKEDLERHVNQQSASAQTTSSPATSSAPSGGKRTEPIRGIKAAMAKQMTESVYTIPHFSVSEEVIMDALIAARAQLKPEFEAQGVKLTYMPFFIKAMSLALKHFPIINSQVNDDCTELTYFDDHNIGMAVDSKIGLVVPNIKQVQNLSLLDVAKEANRLVDQAREGRLSQADLKGGTISISNVGVIGGTVAVPVINKPESAIVALGKMQKLPRFDENDQVKAVNIMHVSWSGDHRIIDGATMVKFCNLWKSYLENPLSMLSELR
ncbi:dihydrolipoyllysine-residue acetyltransferase [Alteromonas sp. a30]|uniref:dihydrolipoyllysine-residue acetyltransferase n=1 Tax=Alteromonas sp. a30 TaxID=2730917 RepID=UPI002280E0BB|nr:dihydrolipoyllysine-residue acetyltransferase [Alteromonas sp. a30]MCY7294129.1 dihydrolipoyllysine-residue acetyltransferase [Alteromonas sp. a30]